MKNKEMLNVVLLDGVNGELVEKVREDEPVEQVVLKSGRVIKVYNDGVLDPGTTLEEAIANNEFTVKVFKMIMEDDMNNSEIIKKLDEEYDNEEYYHKLLDIFAGMQISERLTKAKMKNKSLS
jgi:hypothetical protein